MLTFVDDWRKAWRMWSIRLNVVASAIVAYVVASPGDILYVLNQLPPAIRLPVAIVTGLAIFALVAVTRLAKQETLTPCESTKAAINVAEAMYNDRFDPEGKRDASAKAE